MQQVLTDLALRIKQRRKELKISQIKLAQMCGVTYSSIKRFEQTGNCSFSLILKIAKELDYLDDFDQLFKRPAITNLKDVKI